MADHLSVRDVEPDLWMRLRVAAMHRKLTVGRLLNQILSDWLKANDE